ncbi:pyridoxamine 5'-phosphate oxidase family protein [Skermania sp. ID1734]|uniref:pyridoxamine 5'-phosphate oxidase family protein n=1 Tax=Skermania sp. ID1734 TaxID=2597516 RepID=UPI00117F59E8|nr:pyridoxamine 5'-phosphate oxidase family protein [Skermania sp. ID1734]TSD99677.1 pyridoxamine 5'-phosphate oxidase family protein [Skermania sp. ID1734]
MSTRPSLSPTSRSTVRRLRERAQLDRAALDAVLDEGIICHLGIVLDDAPVVLPTGYGRDGNTLYFHGSTGARSLCAADGTEVCVTVTLLDGLVYARAVMHFSANYRSAVIHGRARLVTDPEERLHGLRVLVEHMAPGSWDRARKPNVKELAATQVLALDLTEAAVKMRSGGPNDDADDVQRGGVWAGVLPARIVWDAPQPAADLEDDVEVPELVATRSRPAVPTFAAPR